MRDREYPVDLIGTKTRSLTSPRPRPVIVRRGLEAIERYWVIALVVLVWQLWIVVRDVNVIVMPSPVDIARDIANHPGEYVRAALPTLGAAVFGWLLGTTIGAAVGLATGMSRIVTGVASPSLILLRSIPIVMIVPVLTRIFDPGRNSVYAITTIVAIFPAFVLVTSAIKSLPLAAEHVAAAFGSSRLRRLRYIHAPAAIPSYFTALRLTASTAFLVAIVAEFLTGAGGIGEVYILARVGLDTARAWGVSIVGAAIAIALYRLAARVELAVAERAT